MEKQCSKCKEIKDISFFIKRSDGKQRYRSQCRACQNIYTRKYFKENRDKCKAKLRKSRLKKDYGITIDIFNQMFLEQEGKCAICHGHQSNFRRSLNVDHNHETGEIRGLLCDKCNLAIGNAREDIAILQSAIQYILKHSIKEISKTEININ